MLKAVTKLGSLSGPGGEKPAFAFDLDDLGLEDRRHQGGALDRREHAPPQQRTCDAHMDIQGKTLKLELRYRLTSSNQPVKFPPISG